jgi:hypothetical protein
VSLQCWLRSDAGAALALAACFTLLNAVKPLHIDDAAMHYYAARIAQHPFDPYGFEINWDQWPVPANELLAPPVVPYWWGAGICLLRDNPVLWKLWLFPFALVLAWSLAVLFRRFAGDLAVPLLVMTLLSPAFLPSFNLMLDIPVLALSLASLALLVHACDRQSTCLTLAAGLIAGLAMQTKYTALIVPAVLLLYATLWRQPRLGVLAAVLACAVFAAWEAWIAQRYGQSHFLLHLRGRTGVSWTRYWALFRGAFHGAGGLAPAVTLLALAALGFSRRWLAAMGALVLLGYAMLGVVPDSLGTLALQQVIFGFFGLALLAAIAAVLWRLRPSQQCDPDERRVRWFLILWLGLELAGYYVLSPFPAARRLLGPIVVATLLVGRFAQESSWAAPRPMALAAIVLFGAALGLGYFAIDCCEARAGQQAVAASLERIRNEPRPSGTIWYTGHWGIQFYAERAGMTPVVPDRSKLQQGDWLVIPFERWSQQHLDRAGAPLERVAQVEIGDGLPWRTVLPFYLGCVPLEHSEGPRMSMTIYRVRGDFTARTPGRGSDQVSEVTPPGAFGRVPRCIP